MQLNQDLEAMLTQISEKFDRTFAHHQPSALEVSPQIQQTSHNLQNSLQPDLQTPINAQAPASPQTPHSQPSQLAAAQSIHEKYTETIHNAIESQAKDASSQSAHEDKYAEQIPTLSQMDNRGEIEEERDAKPLILQGETDENDDLTSYQSLTEQFEVALSKLKHNQSLNLTQTQFTSRQEHYQRKKATDINLLRAQKERQVAKQCTAKPLINSRSQQLLVNHRPIHVRYQAVIEEKKKKLESQVAQKLAKQSQEQEQQMNYIKHHQEEIKRKLGAEIRSEADYYAQMQSWAQAKDKNIQDLTHRQHEQLKLQTTFKPQISPASQAIMKKYTSRVPIYEKTPGPKRAAFDANCTFKPNLNKTTKK